jgi:hypothetical protein
MYTGPNLLRFVERMQADAGVRAALFAKESDVIQYREPAAAQPQWG